MSGPSNPAYPPVSEEAAGEPLLEQLAGLMVRLDTAAKLLGQAGTNRQWWHPYVDIRAKLYGGSGYPTKKEYEKALRKGLGI